MPVVMTSTSAVASGEPVDRFVSHVGVTESRVCRPHARQVSISWTRGRQTTDAGRSRRRPLSIGGLSGFDSRRFDLQRGRFHT